MQRPERLRVESREWEFLGRSSEPLSPPTRVSGVVLLSSLAA